MKGISLDWGPSLIDGSVKGPLETEVPQYLPIQVSVHTVTSRAFLNEMIEIFSHIEWNSHKEVVVVCTMQHAVMELVKMGPDVENEKDRLLENFVEFAKELCQKIINLGYFADYFDPCSGLPALYTDSNKVFSEVFCAQTLLGYSIMNAGCCKILLHPDWGSAVYPASIVTNAPVTEVNRLLGGFVKS